MVNSRARVTPLRSAPQRPNTARIAVGAAKTYDDTPPVTTRRHRSWPAFLVRSVVSARGQPMDVVPVTPQPPPVSWRFDLGLRIALVVVMAAGVGFGIALAHIRPLWLDEVL